MERLQKALARSGVASRRLSEELIGAGRVTVNGQLATLGDKVGASDRIELDGVPILRDPDLVHYLLHKPREVVSTANDPHGRPTVVDLVPSESRVFPVGRLDTDSEGLIVLTNDGDLTHRLTHPSFGVAKEYLAHVEGLPTRLALRRLREGVELDDGPTAPAEVSMPQDGLLKLVIHEGRNRQVRRMCAAVGYPVIRLVRVRIGPITDKDLAAGAWRTLTMEEVRSLYAATIN
ncbi:MAG: MFS transporter [Acidimicrobiaceae bacterium]|nr:MFS transporter [Acidimicrobiaceae bacterium]MBQ28339.1 MFS transporter [Acidimicrobiaceae bacterium]MCS5675079.1 rRNA pseudouridine synthase [Acidimicrobiales bacterium]